MQGLRNRLTYANVMSTIAVFLVLGGATAVAASKLGKNTVGTKQLKANSVTAAKLKRNAVTEAKLKGRAVTERKVGDKAITTAKIADGAVTGAKVQTATLGTVPNAATFSGYSRKGILRVAASPSLDGGNLEASRAASPEVPLLSAGPSPSMRSASTPQDRPAAWPLSRRPKTDRSSTALAQDSKARTSSARTPLRSIVNCNL